jgi:uncharacterized 2Fe-2S/4Fe-4S cluster protein (DUF4445 family)
VESVTVKFLPDDVSVNSNIGQTILEVALDAGVFIKAGCGGAGACGQCKVKLLEGSVDQDSGKRLSDEDIGMGYVLACRSRVTENITVEIAAAKSERKTLPSDDILRLQQTATPMGSPIAAELDPMAMRIYMSPPAPNALDNMSDFDRIIRTLKTDHEIEPVTANLEFIRGLPIKAREKDWDITACLQIEETPLGTSYRLRSILAGHVEEGPTALALDIGTTTLWAELIDLNSGESLAKASRYNPQISMGDDVISRIVYSLKKDNLQKLQRAVAEGINELLEDTLTQTGRSRDSVSYVLAAGNTVMTHLFLGLNSRYLRESPYTPVAQSIGPVRAYVLGLDLPPAAFVRVIPGVASYVGGDIVSGVLANGMNRSDEMTLFIDIGTNGEIVVGNKEMLMTASCSAGPAFEGGGLEYGMRATEGAIESVLIDPETYEPMLKTINSKPALGICGSGIINIIAQMLRLGVLNQNGVFNTELKTGRVRQGKSGGEYVICWKEDAGIDEDITLSEVDMDNIARAKGAMYSGYTCLLDKVGLSPNDLDRVIIAGAFGSFINLDYAITIGLLPDLDREKFSFIGNSSLLGARLAATDRELFNEAARISRKMMNVELSEDHTYMDNFMAALFFPHTKSELFPTVNL